MKVTMSSAPQFAYTPTSTGPDRLGRYYTNGDVSEFLVDQMSVIAPRGILDLGVGDGALSMAALSKWQDVELVTVDIDKTVRTRLSSELKVARPTLKHEHVNADALSNNLPTLIRAKGRCIDVGVCNPPFITPKWRSGFAEILEHTGFSSCIPKLRDVDAAIMFLAQNLRLLSDEGTVGIILPDSLISACRYRGFRRELTARYCIERVIRLPRRSFADTDALAHILVVRKGKTIPQKIPLFCLDESHQLSDPYVVEVEEAVKRLDFKYHADRRHQRKLGKLSANFAAVGAEIKRGVLTSSEHRAADFPTFHTTDIRPEHAGKWCDLSAFTSTPSRHRLKRHLVEAAPGDILMARVGRNLETKIIGVQFGHPVLTDCILRLRLPPEMRRKALAQLSSKSGRAWLASRAYGVGAQHLTKSDLLGFPIDS